MFENKIIAGITEDYLKGPITSLLTRTDVSFSGNDMYYMSKLMTEEEIEANYNKLNKDMIVVWQILSEDFLERHLEDLKLELILRYQVVSENFMKRHCFKPTFTDTYRSMLLTIMLQHQAMSTEFILYILDDVNKYKLFHILATYQSLDVNALERLFNDYTDKNFNHIIIDHLLTYQSIPQPMIKYNPYILNNNNFKKLVGEHQDYPKEFFTENGIPISSAVTLTEDEWKYNVKCTNKYSTFTDHFIGYKIVRADGYSDFNYRFKYESNNTYNTFSDYSYRIIGAGFGIFDESSAKFVLGRRYKNAAKFKIIEVKVNYKDVTYISDIGSPIRAKEITVL